MAAITNQGKPGSYKPRPPTTETTPRSFTGGGNFNGGMPITKTTSGDQIVEYNGNLVLNGPGGKIVGTTSTTTVPITDARGALTAFRQSGETSLVNAGYKVLGYTPDVVVKGYSFGRIARYGGTQNYGTPYGTYGGVADIQVRPAGTPRYTAHDVLKDPSLIRGYQPYAKEGRATSSIPRLNTLMGRNDGGWYITSENIGYTRALTGWDTVPKYGALDPRGAGEGVRNAWNDLGGLAPYDPRRAFIALSSFSLPTKQVPNYSVWQQRPVPTRLETFGWVAGDVASEKSAQFGQWWKNSVTPLLRDDYVGVREVVVDDAGHTKKYGRRNILGTVINDVRGGFEFLAVENEKTINRYAEKGYIGPIGKVSLTYLAARPASYVAGGIYTVQQHPEVIPVGWAAGKAVGWIVEGTGELGMGIKDMPKRTSSLVTKWTAKGTGNAMTTAATWLPPVFGGFAIAGAGAMAWGDILERDIVTSGRTVGRYGVEFAAFGRGFQSAKGQATNTIRKVGNFFGGTKYVPLVSGGGSGGGGGGGGGYATQDLVTRLSTKGRAFETEPNWRANREAFLVNMETRRYTVTKTEYKMVLPLGARQKVEFKYPKTEYWSQKAINSHFNNKPGVNTGGFYWQSYNSVSGKDMIVLEKSVKGTTAGRFSLGHERFHYAFEQTFPGQSLNLNRGGIRIAKKEFSAGELKLLRNSYDKSEIGEELLAETAGYMTAYPKSGTAYARMRAPTFTNAAESLQTNLVREYPYGERPDYRTLKFTESTTKSATFLPVTHASSTRWEMKTRISGGTSEQKGLFVSTKPRTQLYFLLTQQSNRMDAPYSPFTLPKFEEPTIYEMRNIRNYSTDLIRFYKIKKASQLSRPQTLLLAENYMRQHGSLRGFLAGGKVTRPQTVQLADDWMQRKGDPFSAYLTENVYRGGKNEVETVIREGPSVSQTTRWSKGFRGYVQRFLGYRTYTELNGTIIGIRPYRVERVYTGAPEKVRPIEETVNKQYEGYFTSKNPYSPGSGLYSRMYLGSGRPYSYDYRSSGSSRGSSSGYRSIGSGSRSSTGSSGASYTTSSYSFSYGGSSGGSSGGGSSGGGSSGGGSSYTPPYVPSYIGKLPYGVKGGGRAIEKQRRVQFQGKYVQSIVAQLYHIRGSRGEAATSSVTGLGIRPYIRR